MRKRKVRGVAGARVGTKEPLGDVPAVHAAPTVEPSSETDQVNPVSMQAEAAEQVVVVNDDAQPVAPAEDVPATLAPTEEGAVGTLMGYVEALAPQVGLSGWAGVTGGPGGGQTLTLWAGDRELARTTTGLSRNDVAGVHPGLGRYTGFLFTVEAMLPVMTLRDLALSEPLRVVGGNGATGSDAEEVLASRRVWTVGDLNAVLQASVADLAAEHELLALPPHHALDLAWRRAVRWLLEPRTAQPHSVGVIESLALLPSQHVLVGGWWRRGTPLLTGVLVFSGGQRSAGALMSIQFDRADLDGAHCGFVGVLRLSEAVAVVDGRARFSLVLSGSHAGTVEPLPQARILTHAAALQELEAARKRPGAQHAEHAAALVALVRELAPWHPDPAASSHLGVQAGVDQLWVVPGFGALLTGWVMAPVGTLVQVAARLGDAVLQQPADGLHLRPRPDLRSALPQLADRSAHAGFSVVLRGHSRPDTRGDWWLKMGFSDGSVFWLAVPMAQVRVVDQAFDTEQLIRFDAGLDSAPWADELVDAVWGGPHASPVALNHDRPVRPAAEVALVQALPPRASDLNLALDRLAWVAPELARRGVGLVLLLPQTLRAAELESWADVLRCWAPQLLLSWCWVPATGNAWQVLSPVLRQLQSECQTTRFLFAGPQVLLTPEHAADLAEALVSSLGIPLGSPWFPGVEHLDAQERRTVSQDAQLFAWEVGTYLSHVEQIPAWIGGWHDTAGLGEPHVGQITERLAWQLGGGCHGPLARAINNRRMQRWQQQWALQSEGMSAPRGTEASA